jgi:4-amino-4-deoxy-L-arabinose transferase-like glycosyltransferase
VTQENDLSAGGSAGNAGVLPHAARQRERLFRVTTLTALITTIGCYVVFNVHLVSASGLYYDELIQVAPVMQFLRPASQSPWPQLEPAFQIGQHSLSLMTMPYIGAVKQLFMLPGLQLLGSGVFAVRYTTIGLGAVALGLTYAVGRRLAPTSTIAPLLAVALLAVDPSFSFYTRIDYGPTAVMLVARLTAMLLFLSWYRRDRWWILWLSGFVLGIGVYDKTNFLWTVAALCVSAVVVYPRCVRSRFSLRSCSIWVTGLAVGALPLIVYNVKDWSFPTLQAAQSNTDVAHGLFDRLSQRVHVLEDVLTGRVAAYPSGTSIVGHQWWQAALAVVFAAAVLGLWATSPYVRAILRPLAFSALAMAITVAAAVATTGGFAGHHLVLTYPFPQMALAFAVVLVGRAARASDRSRFVAIPAFVVALVVVTAIALLGVRTNQLIAAGFERTGGVGNWSDATARLGPAVRAAKATSPILAADWGISLPLFVYEQGEIPVVDVFPLIVDRTQDAVALPDSVFRPGSLVVLHPPAVTNFPDARTSFFARARPSGLVPHLVSTIDDRSGQPELEVWRLDPR